MKRYVLAAVVAGVLSLGVSAAAFAMIVPDMMKDAAEAAAKAEGERWKQQHDEEIAGLRSQIETLSGSTAEMLEATRNLATATAEAKEVAQKIAEWTEAVGPLQPLTVKLTEHMDRVDRVLTAVEQRFQAEADKPK